MKNFLFKLYLDFIKLILRWTPTNENLYVILNGSGRSGSNGYIFYKYLKSSHPEIEAVLVEPWPSSHLSWQTWKKIAAAKYIFTTHQPFKIKRKQICTDFWHGIPLKRMGFMAANDSYQNDLHNMKIWQSKADRVVSSSALYDTLMSACVGIEGKKYVKTGFPRIDALYKPVISKKQLLQSLFKVNDEIGKIGIYMPTFRFELNDKKIMNKIEEGNFFAFSDFDGEEFNKELQRLHHYLIIKLHPYEMKLFKATEQQYSNIIFLENNYLEKNNLDLYELLGSTDYLMTDFSSIYFDYLHLNKPIIFITNYLEKYEKIRGLLITPYQNVVPGTVVTNQSELLDQITSLNPRDFESKRNYWLKLSYTVSSQDNCKRNFDTLN
ncbi:CDP-glycerol glycerophosphotransferase family protein [Lactobacillus rodentium]|uniref:CDP-glycerol glycerophosphotransferase n=1 Tax=Lactobacillus rodentium TaxID=947835 RepID=A0A2Z6T7U8_9LACO|nr:CDP-glycerol glycerophosphotransferase family protein [Lactobacillus rodentium]MCR1894459.1 CDP-glycerol glycerophosphotransferase family protein [Lactobacillus rodentium]GBG04831.1 CDP-glycerol glycerophosphotransferase [Lactobacillus rodentium]